MLHGPQDLKDRIHQAARLRLFLDYDGTLADFAPTPDDILPDSELIDLLQKLVANPIIQVSVVSGRRLDHVRALVPVSGVLLAGTYGIEIQTPGGGRIDRLDYEQIRPALEDLKPNWEALIAGQEGFYLEDKAWSLALHARFASPPAAEEAIKHARESAESSLDGQIFRILGGHKFLEIAPRIANKGGTIEYLLSRYPLQSSLLIYVGDDDKDEEAFRVILQKGGIAIKVASQTVETLAQLRLESPRAVRKWLRSLL